jgi:fluoride exporter
VSSLRGLTLVALGGAVGAVLRVALAEWFPTHPGGLPWTTLTENVVGAFVLGVLLGALAARRALAPRARALLGAGVLGSFTTYSTFAVETVALLDRAPTTAIAYVVTSLGAGLGAAITGLALGRRLGGHGVGGGTT